MNLKKFLKWFYPGMRIKRWVAFTTFGIILLSMTFVIIISEEKGKAGLGTSILVIIGIMIIITGVKRIINSLTTIFLPNTDSGLVDIVYKKRQLERGPRVVAMGGGTGLSSILHGLKEFTNNITAIVTVADEGLIASGIQEPFDTPQSSDVRDCLIALADAEPVVGSLFNYRFKKGTELWGHNFGNLFLAAMSDIMGDFDKAIKESSKVLAVRGEVIPSTLSKISLIAQHEDGTETVGRQNILNSSSPIKTVYIRPQTAKATKEAVNAIMRAEAVIMAPGALFTNVVPGLLVEGIKEALSASKATKIYMMAIMTKAGETDNYKASDHLRVLSSYVGENLLDYCIANNGQISKEQMKNYEQEGSSPVPIDKEDAFKFGCKVVEAPLVDKASQKVRHDSAKAASLTLDLLNESKRSRSHAK
ncbi:MAG: uridine diphosphate-N-acetylglucosamine-binding protein YvcK [Candidatus Omnitrophica bacterium]|nr:uridine diphosphate-N-acetylglucosamine-binding protein YvcK [Candidatus Omnitrophota bacterium]